MDSIERCVIAIQRAWRRKQEYVDEYYDDEDYDVGDQYDDFIPEANKFTKRDECDMNDSKDYERYMWNMIRDYGLGCVVYDDEPRYEDSSSAWNH